MLERQALHLAAEDAQPLELGEERVLAVAVAHGVKQALQPSAALFDRDWVGRLVDEGRDKPRAGKDRLDRESSGVDFEVPEVALGLEEERRAL